jgi:uncharacterized membrane protein YhaH (DUF805 family)
MGGLGELFGFDGRVNRLGLIGRSVIVGVALAALAAGGATALATLGLGGVGGFQTWTQRLTLAVMLLGLWAGFALTTRRLRDMGIEPVYVVPAYAALWVANTELLIPLTRLQPQSYEPLEAAWMAVQVVLGLVMLAWPSRTAAGPTTAQIAYGGQPTSFVNWREGG